MKKLFSALLMVLAFVAPASAETITAGSFLIDWRGTGAIDVTGDNGSRFVGSVYAGDGIFHGWQLDPTTGAPGMTIDLSGYWQGLSLPGTLTTSSATQTIGSLNSEDWGELSIAAEVVAPESGDAVLLSAPFGFVGTFQIQDAGILELSGFGTALVSLTRFLGDANTPTYWDFTSAKYQFGSFTAPDETNIAHNPEPATFVLALSGLGAIFFRSRRRAR